MSTLNLHLSKFQKRPRQTLLIFHILSQTAVDLWTLGPPPFFASLPKLFFFFYRVVFPPAKKTGWPTEIKQSKSCTGRPEVTRAHIYAGQVMRFWFPGETLTFRFFCCVLPTNQVVTPKVERRKGFFPVGWKLFDKLALPSASSFIRKVNFVAALKFLLTGRRFKHEIVEYSWFMLVDQVGLFFFVFLLSTPTTLCFVDAWQGLERASREGFAVMMTVKCGNRALQRQKWF